MRAIAVAALALCITAPSAPVYGHGGGLNRDGCHRETATGGYHCHRKDSDRDWEAAAAILGGLAVVGIAVWWWNKRRDPPAASLIPAPWDEPRLRYGVQFDGDHPSLRVMWRF